MPLSPPPPPLSPPSTAPQGAALSPARHYGDAVLRLEARAIDALADSLSSSFDDACTVLMNTKGRVIVSGMGKSGHVGRKIAATFASTGTPAHFVHPAEASHGDLGMITVDDVCLLLSNSGETRELHDLVAYTRRFAIPLIGISKNPGSTLLRQSDVALVLPDAPEACAIGMAPTTSTTLSLALGDALAVAVMRLRGFGRDAFHTFHPGGKLGAQFLTVAELMHTGDALPWVTEMAEMPEVLLQMTGKGFGVAPVTDAGRLTGIITDGDLRRNLEGLMTRRACDVATRTPRSIAPDALVSEAVLRMNEAKVHALCVVDQGGMLVGLIRLHDCLRAGVV